MRAGWLAVLLLLVAGELEAVLREVLTSTSFRRPHLWLFMRPLASEPVGPGSAMPKSFLLRRQF
jgi:hypothetical protein